MADHRWSGWPGAWCLDCGVEDQAEVCLATCRLPSMDDYPCADHRNTTGPEPGSGRCDPYGDHHPVVKPDGPGVRTRWYECACGGPWPCENVKAK